MAKPRDHSHRIVATFHQLAADRNAEPTSATAQPVQRKQRTIQTKGTRIRVSCDKTCGTPEDHGPSDHGVQAVSSSQSDSLDNQFLRFLLGLLVLLATLAKAQSGLRHPSNHQLSLPILCDLDVTLAPHDLTKLGEKFDVSIRFSPLTGDSRQADSKSDSAQETHKASP